MFFLDSNSQNKSSFKVVPGLTLHSRKGPHVAPGPRKISTFASYHHPGAGDSKTHSTPGRASICMSGPSSTWSAPGLPDGHGEATADGAETITGLDRGSECPHSVKPGSAPGHAAASRPLLLGLDHVPPFLSKL